MNAEIVLLLGVLLLAGGSISLLIVRLCSPGLQGVGWFSAAFAAGACGAGLLLAPGPHLFSVLGADLALLGSFLLLHLAVLQLTQWRRGALWHGLSLLAAQAGVDTLYLAGVFSLRARVASIGLLVAVQTATTAVALWTFARNKKQIRASAVYSVVVLLGFSVFNVLRSVLLTFLMRNSLWHARLSFLAFTLYLVVALALAFGFFWMTNGVLTAEIEQIASTDPLTRLYNRRVFLRWCEKELLRTQRSGVPFSLLMMDLDHFKQINDNFGHQRGDEVLCATVERMQDSVRGIDVLCRWGGEEFAVLLPNASVEATQIVAERIRENIHRMKVPLRSLEDASAMGPSLTVSIGAATYRDLGDDIAGMLLRADRALYRAKGAGRNCVLVGG